MSREPIDLSRAGPSTRVVHLGRDATDRTGALVPPIHPAAAFAREKVDVPGEFGYSRRGNPTRKVLESALAELHGAKHCFAFGSGMGAVTAAASLLKSGDRVILPDDLYTNTHRLFTQLLPDKQIRPEFVDLTDLDEAERALGQPAGMLWLESPTNPSMKVLDVAELAAMARAQGVPSVVDNSYCSPFFQRPLALGADVVIESTTKYLNGHDDLMGGAVLMNDDGLAERMNLIQYVGGAVPSPFDCWLLLRGMKTLALRMERHQANALAIARFLEGHPKVASVRYPGLESDPGHAVAKRQMSGFSGMVAFEVKGGAEAAKRVVDGTRIFQLAGGLGGVESLINYPATGSGASQAGTKLAPSLSLVRLSVGIEDAEDLIEDLRRALDG